MIFSFLNSQPFNRYYPPQGWATTHFRSLLGSLRRFSVVGAAELRVAVVQLAAGSSTESLRASDIYVTAFLREFRNSSTRIQLVAGASRELHEGLATAFPTFPLLVSGRMISTKLSILALGFQFHSTRTPTPSLSSEVFYFARLLYGMKRHGSATDQAVNGRYSSAAPACGTIRRGNDFPGLMHSHHSS